jgi:predicted nucleotidyltransferase
MQEVIEPKSEALKILCKEMKVQRLYVFGSVVSDFDFDQSSDLDFLI